MVLEALRVLHVFLGPLKPSGAEVMLRAAARHFRAQGVDCEILDGGRDGAGPYAPVLRAAGYIVHHIPYNKNISFFLRLHAFVRRGRYDVVHVHSEAAGLYTALCIFPHAPMVRTVHNNFTFTGLLGFRRRITRALSRILGMRFLAIGPSVQKTERDFFGNPTQLCLNWYDSERFQPPGEREREVVRSQLGLKPDDFAVVTLGNCSKVKNHAAVIGAMALLRANPHVVYLHAGLEDQEQTERKLSAELGLTQNIRFLGALADVRPLLYAADLALMPSLFEGLPISILEALGCGVPALLAETSGLRELPDYFPGVPLCAPTAEGVARGLEAALATPAAERRDRALTWSRLARETFGVAEGVGRYCAVYAKLCPEAPLTRCSST